MVETIHVLPSAELAERVLLPGDPGRTLRLAQDLLERGQVFNRHRGLLGYTGVAHDGQLLSIQTTGMGGPSVAIVVSELVALGARRLLRVGTCGTLSDSIMLGDLVIATDALTQDGTSRALGAGERVSPSPEMLAGLLDAGATVGDRDRAVVRTGTVASTDLFYDERGLEAAWAAAGAVAVEMETATLFALSARLGVQAGALLAVTDLLVPERRRLSAGELAVAEWRLGAVAMRALR